MMCCALEVLPLTVASMVDTPGYGMVGKKELPQPFSYMFIWLKDLEPTFLGSS